MSHSEDKCILKDNITIIISEINQFKNLQELKLNLYHNKITQMCPELQDSRILDLSSNEITQICSEIGRLQNLYHLNLRDNQITQICSEIEQLLNLQELYLNFNRITLICPEMGQLQNLQELYLYCNQITIICPEIGQLRNLQILDLSNNKITQMCPEIGQLRNLQKLYLSSNQITKMCPELEQLRNLQILYLRNNQITIICPEIGQLRNLQVLYLMDNQITIMCPEIGRLQNLHVLYLERNQITQICPEIGQLQNLHVLYLSYNQITIIPANIIQCNNLRCFEYDNNPFNIHIECVQRVLDRIQNRGGTINNLYTDSQNIHTSSIQSSVKKSIFNLLNAISDLKAINSYIDDEILTIKTKQLITEYILIKETHSCLDCTFEEIFNAVWKEICRISELHIEFENEIKRRLNEEMDDSECKCFTGRISRLINCLSGYSDKVQIEISNSEQIGNIISIAKSKYSDIDQIKQIVRKELTERNFSSDIIEEWISYI